MPSPTTDDAPDVTSFLALRFVVALAGASIGLTAVAIFHLI